jgi:hypothetical protein
MVCPGVEGRKDGIMIISTEPSLLLIRVDLFKIFSLVSFCFLCLFCDKGLGISNDDCISLALYIVQDTPHLLYSRFSLSLAFSRDLASLSCTNSLAIVFFFYFWRFQILVPVLFLLVPSCSTRLICHVA